MGVTLSSTRLVVSTPPSHGVPVEQSQESQEFRDLVLPDLAKLLSVTCAERPECSLHSKSGENGTPRQTSPKDVTPSLLLSLPVLAHHSSWPEVTISVPCQSFLLSSILELVPIKPPASFSPPLPNSV